MDQPESEVTQPSKPCRLPLSALQKPNTHIRRVTLRFRRQLESAVLERGPLGIGQAALIHKAVISLRTAALIERILGQVGMPGYTAVHEETQLDGTVIRKSKGLTHPEYVAYTDRLEKALNHVCKAIEKLGLDRAKVVDVWAQIYNRPVISANGSHGDQEDDDDADEAAAGTEANGAATAQPVNGQAEAAGADDQDPGQSDETSERSATE